jgi:DNA-binding NtrC family response regulator
VQWPADVAGATLIEAALFGHERGAFTGADRPRKGHVEQAHGGTLFLDEIADLPMHLQVKLLRVLQERAVQRIGSSHAIPVDARIYCATHTDLRAAVRAGQFREDLYYRINVVELAIPPLRQRRGDILWLADRFLEEQSTLMAEPARRFSPAARAALLAHDWPGNARELRNRIERACVLSTSAALTRDDLFGESRCDDDSAASDGFLTLDAFVAEAELSYLKAVLTIFDGRVGATAAALGISRKTLWEKLRKHGLRPMPRDPQSH